MLTPKRLTRRELACRVVEQGGIIATIERGIRGTHIGDPEMAAIWDRAVREYALLRPSLIAADRALSEALRK